MGGELSDLIVVQRHVHNEGATFHDRMIRRLAYNQQARECICRLRILAKERRYVLQAELLLLGIHAQRVCLHAAHKVGDRLRRIKAQPDWDHFGALWA